MGDHTYSTAQLQGNVWTYPRSILHTFQACPAHILDMSCIWQKRRGSYVSLAAAL